MESEITKLAWRVFRSAFKDGDAVVVENSWGEFLYGKLKATEDGCEISRGGITQELNWDVIELIAHDGFPVKRLMGMTQGEADHRGMATDSEMIIEALENKIPENYRATGMTFGGGCPFVVEGARLTGIHNRGNRGEIFYGSDLEEVLVFEAKDGATMHSYDTDHLFLDF